MRSFILFPIAHGLAPSKLYQKSLGLLWSNKLVFLASKLDGECASIIETQFRNKKISLSFTFY